MIAKPPSPQLKSAIATVVVSLSIMGTINCVAINLPPCAEPTDATAIDVGGTFYYHGAAVNMLTGTIVFTQEGSTIRVVDTTYDFGDNRPLMGEGQLEGNRLVISLVPQNGDTDFRADVTFIFSDGGRTFCVEFSDTNGDAGELGSFRGLRQ